MKKLILFLMLLGALRAQQVGTPIATAAAFQFFDNSGVVLAGGKLCTYQAGTSTPLAAYTDYTLTVHQTNPIVLNSAGRTQGGGLFIGTVPLKIVALKGGDGTCSTGTTLWSQDHITNAATTINGGTGTMTLQGTAQQITVATVGNVITLSIPTILVTGEFSATHAGSLIVFNSANFEVDGNGNVSGSGQGNWITSGYITSSTWFGMNPTPGTPATAPGNGYSAIVYKGGGSGTQMWLYRPDIAAWVSVDFGGGGGGGCAPGGVHFSVQINDGAGGCTGDANFTYATNIVTLAGSAASFQTTGVSGGFDATLCTAPNCIQSPLGGMLANLFTWVEVAAPGISNAGQDSVYADSTKHQLMWSGNASTPYAPIMIATGSITSGHCASFVISGGVTSVVDAGGACTTGGGGGTVASSSVNQVAVYSAATTVVGSSGLTFNPTTGVLSVSGGSGPGITAPAASIAGPIQATGASGALDVTAATAYNAIQAPAGGMGALSFTAVNYVQAGHYATTLASGPPLSTSDTFHAGAISYYTGSTGGPCPVFYDGATWACFSGGTGSGTVTSALQYQVAVYPANGTTVQGYSSFKYDPTTFILSVGNGTVGEIVSTATGTSFAFVVNGGTILMNGQGDASFAGVVSSTGAGGGFNVTTDTARTSIQTVGGMLAAGQINAGTVAGVTSSLVAGAFPTIAFNSYDSYTAGSTGPGGVLQFSNSSGDLTYFTSPSVTVGNPRTTFVSRFVITAGGNITFPGIIGSTQCLQVNTSGVLSGTGASCASSGVTSLTGTTNQISVNGGLGPATGAITLALPQSIATSSSPTFAGITINGTEIISSTLNSTVAAGSGIAYQIQNGLGTPLQINGNGDISLNGSVNAAANTSLGAYRVNGTQVIDASRNLLNIVNESMTGVLTNNNSGSSATGLLIEQSGQLQVDIGYSTNNGLLRLYSNGIITQSFGANTGFQTTTNMQVWTAGFGAKVWDFNASGVTIVGVAGVTCSGSPTGLFASSNGIVTHC